MVTASVRDHDLLMTIDQTADRLQIAYAARQARVEQLRFGLRQS